MDKRIVSLLSGFALAAISWGLPMVGIQNPTLGWILLGGGIVLLLASGFLLVRPIFRKPRREFVFQDARKIEELTFIKDIARQRVLTDTLKQYTNEHTNVKIKFASLKERALSETLSSIFELAGWKTQLGSLPLEPYLHMYFGETEVRGFNKHLVEAVSSALINVGIIRVVSKVDELKIKPENPKWKRAKHKIYLTVGHQD